MNKKLKTLYLGLIAILVLVAVLVLLLVWEPAPADDADSDLTSTSEPAFENPTYTLIDEDPATCESIVITNEHGEYTVSKLGEEIWGDETLQDYSLQDSSYTTLVNNLSIVDTTEMVLEKAENLADYGLDNPAAVAVATFGENEYTLSVGNETVDGGAYYAMIEGDEALYSLNSSIVTVLFKAQLEYVSKTLIAAYDTSDPEALPDITEFNVTRSDLDYDINIVKGMELTEELKEIYAITATHVMTSPIEADVSATTSEEFMLTLFGLNADSVVAIDASSKLEEYGFNEPTLTIDMVHDSRNANIVLGAKVTDSENEYYMLFNENNVVYTVDGDKIAMLTYDPNRILSRLVVLPFIDAVGDITLNIGDKEYLIETEGESEELTATLDGATVDTELYRDFYTLLLSVSVEEMNFVEPEGEPVMTIEYTYRDNSLGKVNEIVELYEAEDRNMIVKVNGNAYFSGRLAYVDKVIEELEHLINGEEIDVDW